MFTPLHASYVVHAHPKHLLKTLPSCPYCLRLSVVEVLTFDDPPCAPPASHDCAHEPEPLGLCLQMLMARKAQSLIDQLQQLGFQEWQCVAAGAVLRCCAASRPFELMPIAWAVAVKRTRAASLHAGLQLATLPIPASCSCSSSHISFLMHLGSCCP